MSQFALVAVTEGLGLLMRRQNSFTNLSTKRNLSDPLRCRATHEGAGPQHVHKLQITT